MLRKAHETGNLLAKDCWNTKQNLHLSWSFLLPNLQSGVLCLFSSVCGGLDPIAIQSNHVLGNTRYTLTECLLANLTDLRFLFGFCLAPKNGFESVFFIDTGQIQWLCCLAFLANSRPCLSHPKTHYKWCPQWSWCFMYQRLLWDIPEFFGVKDGG